MLLMAGYSTDVCAQVSNDNEDEVYKLQNPDAVDFVPGQVLFKLKDGQTAKVRRAAGQATAGISSLDAILKEYAAKDMEQLLPNAKVVGTPRRVKAFSGEAVVDRDLTQLYKVTLAEGKEGKTLEMVKKLNELEEVEFAEPNYKAYLTADGFIAESFNGNPYLNQQWGLDAYGVKELWNKKIVNPERPVIAILDTGVDLTHPDLKDNLWTNAGEASGVGGYDNDGNGFIGDVHGWDFINNSPNIRDNNMHGTHVAGIAAAANNGLGIIGANPQAQIMSVTVMQSDGTGDMATIIKGIDYAAANGATVMNLSLGTYANSVALRQALEKAYQKAVIVAAAGNDAKGIYPQCGSTCFKPMFPGAYSFVLGVMATQPNGNLAYFSNFDCDGPNFSEITTYRDEDGFNYELMAPGTDILSTVPGGNYKVLNGTSMATPLVAGAISALRMVKQYDTQEMLWGDLLHSSNIAGAYDVSDRPAEFDMLRVQYRDRENTASENDEDEYAADGEVDAGETIAIYPVVRTVFGPARNIKMHLEMGDYEDPSMVEILTGDVDFGMNLDAYGRGTALNPLKLKVPSTVADGRHIKMKAVFTCDGLETPYEGKFTMVVANMKKLSGLIETDMTLSADHVYYVNENVAVMKGATLTIEPGTRIEFAEGMGISSSGKLIANGTPEKPIVFARHTGEGAWTGVKSHNSDGQHSHCSVLYTNADSTKFTFAKTEETPILIEGGIYTGFYYDKNKLGDLETNRWFSYDQYFGNNFSFDLTARLNLLKDPDYLTPGITAMLADMKKCAEEYTDPSKSQEWSEDKTWIGINGGIPCWYTYDNPRDTISYCRIEGFMADDWENIYPYMEDCCITPDDASYNYCLFQNLVGIRNVITGVNGNNNVRPFDVNFNEYDLYNLKHSNIVNNYFGNLYSGNSSGLPRYSWLNENNWFNNSKTCTIEGKYYGSYYSLAVMTKEASVDKSTTPSYLGTSKEEIVRPMLYEIGNAPNTFGKIDLSNMRTTPVPEAHGIVWKVVVNGKDAQDEYNELAPLGVGTHEFKIYFNRKMNTKVVPQVSFGVRDPWTQNPVDENGSWNADGTIYTVYKTITGKTNSDGVNRIYVYGAEDDEFFEVPVEKKRFNVEIQAAGSMASGFSAEPGMGKVSLKWNNSENDFEDAMGFNIYRYHEYMGEVPVLDEWGNKIVDYYAWNDEGTETYPVYRTEPGLVRDTVCINDGIVDITTTSYIDYDVTPKTTYYYYYKVLSTDLKEYDVSNVVSVTPLTSTRGDANGSGAVDVNDVITTVNYAAGKNPKPFIFEAADMNTDKIIDILDVIGIIRGVLNPSLLTVSMLDEEQATYLIEDGILYVNTPVELAGVQVQLAAQKDTEFTVADGLTGFETTSSWLSDNDYMFMAYNVNGKTLYSGMHALLYIGDAEVVNIRLGDTAGNRVNAVLEDEGNQETTGIDRMGKDVMNSKGIYSLKGQKLAGSASMLDKLPSGVYIVDGVKVVK